MSAVSDRARCPYALSRTFAAWAGAQRDGDLRVVDALAGEDALLLVRLPREVVLPEERLHRVAALLFAIQLGLPHDGLVAERVARLDAGERLARSGGRRGARGRARAAHRGSSPHASTRRGPPRARPWCPRRAAPARRAGPG